MQFNMFEAGATQVPPKKPKNPSIGYPSNGDLSHGQAPTQLGAYWVYQLSEEFTALLKDNGIEPSPDDLHQLSKFFKNYKSAMAEIKEVAVEAGSGAKSVLEDMRKTQKEMVALKAGTAQDLKQTREDLASTRNAMSEVNAVLNDARAYTQKFNQFQGNLDSSKGQIQNLLTQNSSLEGEIKKDLSEIAKKQSAIHDMETHIASVKEEVDSINSTLTQKAEDVAKILTSVNETEKQMLSQLKQAGAAVEAAEGIKRDVSLLKDESVSSIETIRSLKKQAIDTVNVGLEDVKTVANGVNRGKEETRSYRDQAQRAADKAEASAEQAKHVEWNDIQGKPTLGRLAGKDRVSASDIDELPSGTPTGMVAMFLALQPPEGWLLCNGASVNQKDYAELFAVIGTTYGKGSGSDTFNLPNLNHRFLEGTTSYSEVGKSVEAGIPNITGELKPHPEGGFNSEIRSGLKGAFSLRETGRDYGISRSAGSINAAANLIFDASLADNHFGRSVTVQPSSLRLLPCIKF